MELTQRQCKPCKPDIQPLNTDQISCLLTQLYPDWDVFENKRIRRNFEFMNYAQAVVFANKVANLAESEGHHPIIHIYYAKIIIEIWTFVIKGLSENDFILAAKIDDLY